MGDIFKQHSVLAAAHTTGVLWLRRVWLTYVWADIYTDSMPQLALFLFWPMRCC